MTTGLEGVGELISVEQGKEEEEGGQVGETTVPQLPAIPLIIVEVVRQRS